MADRLARAKLATAAKRLNAARGAPHLPPLILLTDDERLPDPLPSIDALPNGSGVILRARDGKRRAALAKAVILLAKRRGLVVLIADDAELTIRCGADGLHLPEAKAATALHWRVRQPRWLITCAAHSLRAVTRAKAFGVDAVLLSPAFPTDSHPERQAIGPLRVGLMARQVSLPVYALGGIDYRNVTRLHGTNIAGVAAIGALAADP